MLVFSEDFAATPPALIDTAEIDETHTTVTFTVPSDIPAGETVYVEGAVRPGTTTVSSIVDDRGNTYEVVVEEGYAYFYRGYVDTPLRAGDEITITYSASADQTAATAYHVSGLADANAVDSAHAGSAGVVGPVSVPADGTALAGVYMASLTVESGYAQDPAFTDIGSARVEGVAGLLRVDSSYREASGSYSYDPTLEVGAGSRRLTIAAFASGWNATKWLNEDIGLGFTKLSAERGQMTVTSVGPTNAGDVRQTVLVGGVPLVANNIRADFTLNIPVPPAATSVGYGFGLNLRTDGVWSTTAHDPLNGYRYGIYRNANGSYAVFIGRSQAGSFDFSATHNIPSNPNIDTLLVRMEAVGTWLRVAARDASLGPIPEGSWDVEWDQGGTFTAGQVSISVRGDVGTSATERTGYIEDLVISAVSTSYGPPAEADWIDRGVIVPHGDGSDRYLAGGAGSCTVVPFNGHWNLYYIGGDTTEGAFNTRSRSLHVARCPLTSDPTDPINWTKYAGNPILTWFPAGVGVSPEEGVYSLAPYVDGGTLHALIGVLTDPAPPNSSQVSIAVRHYTSTDGLSFVDQGEVIPAGPQAPGVGALDERWVQNAVWRVGSSWHALMAQNDSQAPTTYNLWHVPGTAINTWNVAARTQLVGLGTNAQLVTINGNPYLFTGRFETAGEVRPVDPANPLGFAAQPALRTYSTSLIKPNATLYFDDISGAWWMLTYDWDIDPDDAELHLYTAAATVVDVPRPALPAQLLGVIRQ